MAEADHVTDLDPRVALSPLELVLPDEIDVAAAALGAGRGPLDALRRATALQWTLELLAGAELARAHLPGSSAARLLLALAAALAEAPAEEVARWMASPAFRAWLYRARVHLFELRERGAPGPAMADHVGLLPLLLAGQPAWEAAAPGGPQRLRMPARGLSPVGAAARLRPDVPGLEVMLSAAGEGAWEVRAGEALVARGHAAGGGVDWRGAGEGPLQVEPRTFIVGGGVELLAADDHPELAELRSPAERPSDLDPLAVDAELSRALAILGWVWPEVMIDVAYHFRGLLAMDMPLGRWNSASTRELPLVLQLTLRRQGNPWLLAESIVHESAHVRIDEATFLQPLIVDDGRRIFRHPWRPDLRPITGVLLGAHAFLSVVLYYRRGLEIFPGDPFLARELEVRTREVGEALDMIEHHARLTSAGERVYAAMRRLHGG
ncbi:MAG: hypothetical protein H6711_26860 [Myxococcales bacterium]|nr:hypothetical protein [Myxococcales bacterium]